MTRIAFPTDDGVTISAHLGRAASFLVVTLNPDGTTSIETRPKPVHHHGHGHDHQPNNQPQAHPGQAMFASLQDVQVLISRGMGAPAYARAQSLGMQVFMVAELNIQAALHTYRAGTLTSDPRRVHAPH